MVICTDEMVMASQEVNSLTDKRCADSHAIDYDNVSARPGIALYGTNYHDPQPVPPLGSTDLGL
ncbi:MAG: hypothetical protein QM743_07585 [Chitinophagaceae bacterium]